MADIKWARVENRAAEISKNAIVAYWKDSDPYHIRNIHEEFERLADLLGYEIKRKGDAIEETPEAAA